jgi:hypothetical protein
MQLRGSATKFFLFILLNFFLFFQFFFSLNFFFSALVDEELIICVAIFLVFILFINHIVSGLQNVLKARIEIYLNVFLLVFRLLRKVIRRFKKHNLKALNARAALLFFFVQMFLKNLTSFSNYQNALILYVMHIRFKSIIDSVIADFDLRSHLKKRFLKEAYSRELQYFQMLKCFK